MKLYRYPEGTTTTTNWLIVIVLVVVVVVVVCPVSTDGQPIDGWNYCAGVTRLTNSTGVITDHEGPGNYQEQVSCTWIIQPTEPCKYLTLMFTKFNLEYGWDTLQIYNGNTTYSLLYSFTGYNLPSVVTTPGPAVTIVFTSDQLITYSGFALKYTIANCTNQCSSNGYCTFNECHCNGGYKGSLCESTFCNATSCGANGNCSKSHNKCVCNTGYYGGDCQSDYCGGIVTLTSSSGIFADHRSSSDYAPYSNCTWIIIPSTPADAIALKFIYFDTDPKDVLTIYDGTDGGIIASLSGYYKQIPPIVGVLPAMRLVFRSDGVSQKKGFQIFYETVVCPASCSGHGVCNFGSCVCDFGWSGTACNESICEANCSGNGYCSNNQCSCFQGFMGKDCSICKEPAVCNNTLGTCENMQLLLDERKTFSMYLDPSKVVNCSFDIQTPADSLTLRFDVYNLTTGAACTIWNPIVNSSNSILVDYYGRRFSKYPVVLSTSNRVQGSLRAVNSAISGNSVIIANYYGSNCTNSCSGQGYCRDGLCICYSGWTGEACNMTSCTNNCSGNGFCNKTSNQCVCNPGFYGLDCRSTDCSGLSVLKTKSGTITDHVIGSQYLPNQVCQWLVKPPLPGQAVSLTFTKFQLENPDDRVTVYDGDTTDSPLLLDKSGSWLPSPVKSSFGAMLIEFRTGPKTQFSGFAANFYTNDLCSCGNAGICTDTGCICNDPGKLAPNCTEDAPVISLTQGSVFSSSVPNWNWIFFTYDINDTVGELTITVNRTSMNGNPEFYLRYGSLPTLNDFIKSNFYYSTDHKFSIRSPKIGKWFLGVYGRKTEGSNVTRFSVSAYAGCVENCGGLGTCVNNQYCVCNMTQYMNCSGNGYCKDGGCECYDGFFGSQCQASLCTPTCKNGGSCIGYNQCNCAGTGFFGSTCTDTKNISTTPVCSPPCLNGGLCVAENQCNCSATQYTGPYCTEFTCDPPCMNGGDCIGPNRCYVEEDHQVKEHTERDKSNTKNVLVGLIVALCCSILGLGSIIVAILLLRRIRASRSPIIGAAGLDEVNHQTPSS